MAQEPSLQDALRQVLEMDRLLGVKSIPIVPPPPPPQPNGRTVTAIQGNAQDVAPHPAGRRAAGAARPRRQATGDSNTEQQVRHKRELLQAVDELQVKGCRKCRLCETRSNTVFGQGNPDAQLVLVGEAPGFEEDRQGLAFVGPAGQLLTRMIGAMGLSRDAVFICNVLKCRPPNNRDPAADEIVACSPYLYEQIRIIDPEVIVALGAPAAKTLLGTALSIGKLRGRFHEFRLPGGGPDVELIPLMPTYHPAYLLRNPSEKRKAWEDLQMVMALMGLPLQEEPRRPGQT